MRLPRPSEGEFVNCECVEGDLPLTAPQLTTYNQLLNLKEFEMALQLAKTSREEGREEGIEEGQREMLWELLQEKFPAVEASHKQRIETMAMAQVRELARKILKATSLADLGLDDACQAQ